MACFRKTPLKKLQNDNNNDNNNNINNNNDNKRFKKQLGTLNFSNIWPFQAAKLQQLIIFPSMD